MEGVGDARKEGKLEERGGKCHRENFVMFKTFASLTLRHFLAITLL